MSERIIGYNLELKPVEIAAVPQDFDWRKEAWYNSNQHPIQRFIDQAIWVYKPIQDKGYRFCPPRVGITYQIIPFAFLDESATQATGCHIIIPEGGFSNIVKIVDKNFRSRSRIVSGAGWLIGKTPSGEKFQQWLGGENQPSQVFEFSTDWISQLTSAVGYGPLVVEYIEIPEYAPGCEIVLSSMNESSVQIFQQAADFWQEGNRPELSKLAVKHIETTLAYAKEHPEEIIKREEQLDKAISLFNEQRKTGEFIDEAVNAKKLATEILEASEPLPLLAEMPQDTAAREAFIRGFLDMVHIRYYTFLNKRKLFDPKILITGLLVDGYSFALRAKRVIEHRRTIGKDDLIICNTICEMVEPGILQEEMVKANWYKPKYGLQPEFCTKIKAQYSA